MRKFFSEKRYVYQEGDRFLQRKKEDLRELENKYNYDLLGFFGWFLVFSEKAKPLNISEEEIFNFLEKIWFGFLNMSQNYQEISIDKKFVSPYSLKLLQSFKITLKTDFLDVIKKVIENFYQKTNKEKEKIFQELSIPKNKISSFISLFQNSPADWGYGLDKLHDAYGNGFLSVFLYTKIFFEQKNS